MRGRRPGLAGLDHARLRQEKFKVVGEELKAERIQNLKEQMAFFKSSLEKFALDYRKEIRSNPEFRAQFHQMCANIGVDPLASNKSTWNKLLGFGDFYYELGVQVAEACLASKPYNGGLVKLSTLRKYVARRRGSRAEPVSKDDVLQAIKKLQVLDKSFQVLQIGGCEYVSSVPREVNMDAHAVLGFAQGKGYIALTELEKQAGWSTARAQIALDALMHDGTAMVDDGEPGQERLFWFPCLAEAQAAG